MKIPFKNEINSFDFHFYIPMTRGYYFKTSKMTKSRLTFYIHS